MKKNGFSYLKRLVRVVAVSYLGVVFILYFFQEKFMFFPKVLDKEFVFQFSGTFQEKSLQIGNDNIHGLLFTVKDSRGVILYLHGNAGAMDTWGDVAAELAAKTSYDVWMVDYPGYGKSTGKIRSQEQLLEMTRSLVAEVRKTLPEQKLIIYGRSVGSGMAVAAAAENKVEGLILETPYTSLLDMAKLRFAWFPQILLKYTMPSKQWITKVQVPVLILHGDQDQVIPAEMGYALAQSSPKASCVLIPGGTHSNLSEYSSYWEAIQDYLK